MLELLIIGVLTGEDLEIRELRREIEQLRSEVRRSGETKDSDNTKVIMDWLIDSMRELQTEVRDIVSNRNKQQHDIVNNINFENINQKLTKMNADILKLKVTEEKHYSQVEEVKFDLKHFANDNTAATGFSRSKIKPHPERNLSKKNLLNWMTTTDSFSQYIGQMVNNLRNDVSIMRAKIEELNCSCH